MPTNDQKLETKKNNFQILQSQNNSKLKNSFNFGGKAVVRNLKSFYEDYVSTNIKNATKVQIN